MQAAVGPCWQLNPSAELHWRLLDSTWVVFECRSGSTHELEALSAAILMAFEAGDVLDEVNLLRQVRSDLGLDCLSVADLSVTLRQFCQLGLLLPAGRHNLSHAAG
jgi:PqqD family protein of HPr-rel-A system